MAQSSTGGAFNVFVLDASVWISRLLVQDSNHLRAKRWVDGHIQGGGRFVAPILLVIETAATANRNTGNSIFAHDVSSQLYTLPVLEIVQLDQTLVNDAVGIAADYGVKTADSVYVAVARTLNLPLVTFDRDVIKRALHIVAIVEPQ